MDAEQKDTYWIRDLGEWYRRYVFETMQGKHGGTARAKRHAIESWNSHLEEFIEKRFRTKWTPKEKKKLATDIRKATAEEFHKTLQHVHSQELRPKSKVSERKTRIPKPQNITVKHP